MKGRVFLSVVDRFFESDLFARWLGPGVLGVFFVLFLFPLSSKFVNNFYYSIVAFPVLLWVCASFKVLAKIVRAQWAFFTLLAALVIVSANKLSDLKELLYIFLFCAALLLLEVRAEGVKKACTFFSIAGLAIFSFVLIHWVILYEVTGVWVRYGRLFGAEVNPVYLALLILFSLLFVWLFYIEAWILQRRAYFLCGFSLLCMLVFLCALVFQARSALLGFSFFFWAYLFFRKKLLLGFFVILLLGIGAVFLGDALLDRGLSYRPAIWRDAWQRLISHCNLLWGCGSDGYLFLGKFHHAHSGYMSMLYRSGLLGAVVLMLFAILFFTGIRREGVPWMLLALVGWGSIITTTNGVITSPEPLWVYFWLPVFMAFLRSGKVASAYGLKSQDALAQRKR